MGICLFGNSVSKTYENYEEEKVNEFDPNPSKFKIIKHYENNMNTAIFINYPNCINYEGNKIIVYLDVRYIVIKTFKEIDPHFTDKNMIKPFARFEPTEDGWEEACNLVDNI